MAIFAEGELARPAESPLWDGVAFWKIWIVGDDPVVSALPDVGAPSTSLRQGPRTGPSRTGAGPSPKLENLRTRTPMRAPRSECFASQAAANNNPSPYVYARQLRLRHGGRCG